ncbi:TolC family protein [Solitalea canadensis]|uniref:Outer membrane protein n=1 Tax=Solitalea canadensis (strain ATCC 29591 / DSM 3403 / JCM 21819 / LMG 8368 / NBRC 15130 / NCIMB 12057 / USAM 9D) TaxID=929556 RepID=H8KQM8_SOLCM|nr:TolC family protein [Solitalea canadensis]AFD06766.1 outer membrane protein [Solitalea canadensis DSM 3403]
MILNTFIANKFKCTAYCIAVFLIFLFPVNNLYAQELNHATKLTLQDAIELARHKNKEIKQAKVKNEISADNIQLIKQLRLPDVELHTSYARVTNLNQYENGLFSAPEMFKNIPDMYDVTMNAKMPLYMGNKINNEIEKSAQEQQITELKSRKIANDIQINVINMYLGTYKLMLFSDVLKEQIKEEVDRLAEVKALKRNGALTKNDLLRAELQLSNMKLALINNEANTSIALHQLKTLLEIPENEDLKIDTSSVSNVLLPNNEYDAYVSAALHKEELQIAEKEAGIAQTDRKITQGNYYPKVALFGTYGYNYPNYKFFPPTPYLYTLGLAGIDVSFSLSELFKNKKKMSVANKKIEQQLLEAEIVKNNIIDKVYKEYKQYTASKEKLTVTEQSVMQANENYRIVRMKYLNQLALITDMIDADNSLLEAKFTDVSAKVDAQLKYYQLQHAAGILNN